MITPEQVADLQPGDVVEIGHPMWEGAVIKGPVRGVFDGDSHRDLYVGPQLLAGATWLASLSLTVVSHGPRPLYVNHSRTEPEMGDVVRDCDGDIWHRRWDGWQVAIPDEESGDDGPEHFKPLVLLVDGETGQVVQ